MIITISQKKLIELTARQLDNLFVLEGDKDREDLQIGIELALKKTKYCFTFSVNEYYRKDDRVIFNPYQSGQYAIFLYFLCKIVINQCGNDLLADKIYYLNKVLNGVDLYHTIDLPDIFGLDHPLGSVIGRATFSDYFFFTQNCTVGNNNGIYPSFGENVILFAKAAVIGDSHIGNNCIISANTYVKDQDVPDNSIVFGSSPDLVIKTKDESYFWENGLFNKIPPKT